MPLFAVIVAALRSVLRNPVVQWPVPFLSLMQRRISNHILLGIVLAVVAVGTFSMPLVPLLADTEDEQDGMGWCCPDFGGACVPSDTAFQCAFTDNGILYAETKNGCQAQCSPGSFSQGSASSASFVSAGASSAASYSSYIFSSASGVSSAASFSSSVSAIVSSSSVSSVVSFASSSFSSQTASSVSATSASSSSVLIVAEPWYAWCSVVDRTFHVGQDSWTGFLNERLTFESKGGVPRRIEDADIDEYWGDYPLDLNECENPPSSSSSASSDSSASSISSDSSASFGSSFSSSLRSVSAGPVPIACDRRLGISEYCYEYAPQYQSHNLDNITLFLGDIATMHICSAICPSVRNIAVCVAESGCGSLDATQCILEGGFPISYLTQTEARAAGFTNPDEEAFDACSILRSCFFLGGNEC